jgi:hypothetical protein
MNKLILLGILLLVSCTKEKVKIEYRDVYVEQQAEVNAETGEMNADQIADLSYDYFVQEAKKLSLIIPSNDVEFSDKIDITINSRPDHLTFNQEAFLVKFFTHMLMIGNIEPDEYQMGQESIRRFMEERLNQLKNSEEFKNFPVMTKLYSYLFKMFNFDETLIPLGLKYISEYGVNNQLNRADIIRYVSKAKKSDLLSAEMSEDRVLKLLQFHDTKDIDLGFIDGLNVLIDKSTGNDKSIEKLKKIEDERIVILNDLSHYVSTHVNSSYYKFQDYDFKHPLTYVYANMPFTQTGFMHSSFSIREYEQYERVINEMSLFNTEMKRSKCKEDIALKQIDCYRFYQEQVITNRYFLQQAQVSMNIPNFSMANSEFSITTRDKVKKIYKKMVEDVVAGVNYLGPDKKLKTIESFFQDDSVNSPNNEFDLDGASSSTINNLRTLSLGRNVQLTPGVYYLNQDLKINGSEKNFGMSPMAIILTRGYNLEILAKSISGLWIDTKKTYIEKDVSPKYPTFSNTGITKTKWSELLLPSQGHDTFDMHSPDPNVYYYQNMEKYFLRGDNELIHGAKERNGDDADDSGAIIVTVGKFDGFNLVSQIANDGMDGANGQNSRTKNGKTFINIKQGRSYEKCVYRGSHRPPRFGEVKNINGADCTLNSSVSETKYNLYRLESGDGGKAGNAGSYKFNVTSEKGPSNFLTHLTYGGDGGKAGKQPEGIKSPDFEIGQSQKNGEDSEEKPWTSEQ